MRDGVGSFVWACGDRYEGQWSHDNRSGKGKMNWIRAKVHSSEYVLLIIIMQFEYEGEWLNDCPTDEENCVHPGRTFKFIVDLMQVFGSA